MGVNRDGILILRKQIIQIYVYCVHEELGSSNLCFSVTGGSSNLCFSVTGGGHR